MKKRKNIVNTLVRVTMAFTIVWSSVTMRVVRATDEEATTEVASTPVTTEAMTEAVTTETTSETETVVAEEPKVGDIVKLNEAEVTIWDSNGRYKAVLRTSIKNEVYIISNYDENRWRVNIPLLNEPERVLLLDKTADMTVISHDGRVLGDLCNDFHVDVFDLCLMRRAILEDLNLDDYSDIEALIDRSWTRVLADVNSDREFNIADLVWLQNWLLGRIS